MCFVAVLFARLLVGSNRGAIGVLDIYIVRNLIFALDDPDFQSQSQNLTSAIVLNLSIAKYKDGDSLFQCVIQICWDRD